MTSTTKKLLNIEGITAAYDDPPYSWIDYEIHIQLGTEWTVIKQIEDLDLEIVEFGDPSSRENTLLLKNRDDVTFEPDDIPDAKPYQ